MSIPTLKYGIISLDLHHNFSAAIEGTSITDVLGILYRIMRYVDSIISVTIFVKLPTFP